MDVSHNSIASAPPGLALCRDLRTLNISFNNLAVVPPSLSSLSRLTALDLSHNSIKYSLSNDMSAAFYGLRSISKLNLSYNSLSRLPLAFFSMATLVTVDISHNQITELQNDMGLLTRLESLFADFNMLTILPKGIAGCGEKLSFISLNNNCITHLPKSILALNVLHSLSLHHNQLRAFPSHLYAIPNMMHINVSWNDQLPGLYIDQGKEDISHQYDTHLVDLITLKRLLRNAWGHLDISSTAKQSICGSKANAEASPTVSTRTPSIASVIMSSDMNGGNCEVNCPSGDNTARNLEEVNDRQTMPSGDDPVQVTVLNPVPPTTDQQEVELSPTDNSVSIFLIQPWCDLLSHLNTFHKTLDRDSRIDGKD